MFGELPDSSAALKYRIRCPWVHEHTGGDASGTFVGQYENGALFFQCHHAHCAARGWREFRREAVTPVGNPVLMSLPGYTGTPLEVRVNHA